MSQLARFSHIFPGHDGQQAQSVVSTDEIVLYGSSFSTSPQDIASLLEALKKSTPSTGAEFESIVKRSMRHKGEVRAGLWLHANRLFAMTEDAMEVYIRRRGATVRLLAPSSYATGLSADGDMLFLTDPQHLPTIKQMGGFDHLLSSNVTDKEIQDRLSAHEKAGSNAWCVVQRVVFEAHEEPSGAYEPPQKEKKPSFFVRLALWLRRSILSLRRHKKYAAFILIALILILGWNVYGGLQGRLSQQQQQQVLSTQEYVEQQLALSQDVADINKARASTLLEDARAAVATLRSTIGQTEEVVALLAKVDAAKETLDSAGKREAEEYFDLAVENKGATGAFMSTVAEDGARVAIYDPQGFVYVLDLEKKSLEKQVVRNISNIVDVTIGGDDLYVLRSVDRAVARVADDGSALTVVKRDDAWKGPQQIVYYSGNLYVLDPSAKQIHRYGGTSDGFGDNTAYFKGEPEIGSAENFAIDGSIYLVLESGIVKYTSGLQDGFDPQLPSGASVRSVVASTSLDSLYVWDKQNGKIYALSKTGGYQFEVSSSILKKGSNMVVVGQNAYILVESKIYRLALVEESEEEDLENQQ